MNKVTRVFVTGCYGVANVGDELLLLTLNQWVSKLGGELTVLSLDPKHTSSVMNLPAVNFFDVSEIARTMETMDLLVMGGGGIFQDHYRFDISALYDPDAYEISSYARPFYIAKQFGIPTLIWAHGVGPLSGSGAKDMTRDIFSTVDFVSVRDKDSAELLHNDLGIKRQIVVAPDPSWSMVSSPDFFNRKIDPGLPSGKKRLGLIVRNWSIEKDWTKKLVDALKDVLTPEWECTWIGFQTVRDNKISASDRPFLEELSAQLGGDVSSTVVDDLLSEEAGATISQCDAVLAMRLHGAILSLAAGVPTLSYEYDKKMGLAMDMVSLPSHLRVQLSDPGKKLAEALRHIMGQTGAAWRLPEGELESLATSALAHRKVLAEAMEYARSRKMPVHWEAGQYDWLKSWRFSDSYKARARDVAVAERDTQIATLSQEVAERDGQIATLSQEVTERDGQIATLSQEVTERDGRIATLRSELTSIMSMYQTMRDSRSWRILAPMRFAARLARYGLVADDRRWFERKLRSLFRKLPFSISTKIVIRGWYARLFGRSLLDSDPQRAFLRLPDVHLLEPEYHGDANSGDGTGVLAYRAYGKELENQLSNVGLSLLYEKNHLTDRAILNTELYYCRAQQAATSQPKSVTHTGEHKTGTTPLKTSFLSASRHAKSAADSRPKVIIHAGAHKTGTTFIQNYLLNHFQRDGFFYLKPEILNSNDFLGLVQGLHDRPIEFLELARNAGWRPGRTIIVSHESLLGYSHMLAKGEKSYFYGLIGENARRIKRLLNACELHLIYYIRRQDNFIESLYLEHLSNLHLEMDFESFVSLQNPDHMSWLSLLNELTEVFGVDYVRFGLFEEISKGSRRFLADFLSLIGCNVEEDELPSCEKSRSSLSRVGYELAISNLKLLSTREDKFKLLTFLTKNFSNSTHPRADLFTPDSRAWLMNACEPENRIMFDKYFPNMDRSLWALPDIAVIES